MPLMSLATPDLTPAFVQALAFVLAREGGYSNNPADPGGETNYGVTHETYASYYTARGLQAPGRVRDISMADVVAIYWSRWNEGRCDTIAATHPRLALAHFDAGVNMGLVQAARCLQRVLLVPADGVIGPQTLGAVAACDDEVACLTALLEDRAQVYRQIVARRPAAAEFLPGWLARLRWVARACGTPITAAFAEARR
jgi:lysozyme family protein